jgi:hypothetical protein
MLFTAFFDEADTHGPSPTVIMAGVLGDAQQWQTFDRGLLDLQRRHGFSIFHVEEFKGQSGEFAGWSDAKCRNLLNDLTQLVQDTLTHGVAVHLERDRYLKEYRALPVPEKMTLDSQYGLCFRACMRQLFEILTPEVGQHCLNVVMESGHQNVGDSIRIFEDLKRRLKQRRGIDLLGEISISNKKEQPRLMVADFLASSYSMIRASHDQGGFDDDVAEVQEPPKGQAGLTYLEFLPGELRRLKENFETDRQEAAAAWRARRHQKNILNWDRSRTTRPRSGTESQ